MRASAVAYHASPSVSRPCGVLADIVKDHVMDKNRDQPHLHTGHDELQ